MQKSNKYMYLADAAVLLVAFVWGSNNVVMRAALSDITPYWFCVIRFFIASCAVMLVYGRRAAAMPKRDKITGLIIGCVFSMGYISGAAGLVYTTAGNQSFIASMSVVFVPFITWAVTKKFPGWYVIISVVLCVAGTAGLVLDSNLTANKGDLLSALAMLFVTAHILLLQKFAPKVDPLGLACWQAVGCAVVSLAFALTCEPIPSGIELKPLYAILYTGTIGFALTLVLQTAAQKYTSSTHTAICLSTSGLFGSALGIIFLSEPMTLKIFVSSMMIFAGVLLVEIVPIMKERAKAR